MNTTISMFPRSRLKRKGYVVKVIMMNAGIFSNVSFLPNIVLSGSYLISNPNVFNGFEKKFDGMFNMGVVATIPVFHFGERWHTLKAARLTHENSLLELQEAKELIELQVNQNAFRIAEEIKKQVAAVHNVDQAVQNLHSASEGFNAGVIPVTDYMMAQTAWLSAKSELIDANIEMSLCDLYLRKSMGTIEIPVRQK